MIWIICFLLSLVVSGLGQGNQGQTVCHNNQQQLTEDEVIQRVVNEFDYDNSSVIETWETFLFFGELLGQTSTDMIPVLQHLTDEQVVALLITLGEGAHFISKQEFTRQWHTRFHDSLAFIESAFDNIIDTNGNGVIDASEMHELMLDARTNYDANGDHLLQDSELVTFFEHIYKSGDCAQVIG